MKLKRALELCQAPLEASKSHLVKVDRYALIHTLDEYAKIVATAQDLRNKLLVAETRFNELNGEYNQQLAEAAAFRIKAGQEKAELETELLKLKKENATLEELTEKVNALEALKEENEALKSDFLQKKIDALKQLA